MERGRGVNRFTPPRSLISYSRSNDQGARLNTAQPPPPKTAIHSAFTQWCTFTLTTVSARVSILLPWSVKWLSMTTVADSSPPFFGASKARRHSCPLVRWIGAPHLQLHAASLRDWQGEWPLVHQLTSMGVGLPPPGPSLADEEGYTWETRESLKPKSNIS
jgi:hypothetical protein